MILGSADLTTPTIVTDAGKKVGYFTWQCIPQYTLGFKMNDHAIGPSERSLKVRSGEPTRDSVPNEAILVCQSTIHKP